MPEKQRTLLLVSGDKYCVSKPTLIDLYREDLDSQTNTHVRQAVRRYWYRAVIITLNEREMTPMPIPRRSEKKKPTKMDMVINGKRVVLPYDGGEYVERWCPFWRGLPDSELVVLLEYLAPYFMRRENPFSLED